MELISCDVENFGCLSNFHYDFSDGVNSICADNGFGKSTLAAFIRIMFYGFENQGKKMHLLMSELNISHGRGASTEVKLHLKQVARAILWRKPLATKKQRMFFSLETLLPIWK